MKEITSFLHTFLGTIHVRFVQREEAIKLPHFYYIKFLSVRKLHI